jgi:CO dehydrogenase/acetyl-CoA synthase beta subunit
MSSVEREFPLPRQVGNGVMGNAMSDYIPERHRDAIDNEPPARKVNNIKGWLRLLTHREMKEFVEEIFHAHEQLFSQDQSGHAAEGVITRVQLADVFDKIAYGE